MEKKQLTTAAGRPVGDNQNSLTVGPRGPTVNEFWLSPTGRPASVVITLLFISSAIYHLKFVGAVTHNSLLTTILLTLRTNPNHIHRIPFHHKTARQLAPLRQSSQRLLIYVCNCLAL